RSRSADARLVGRAHAARDRRLQAGSLSRTLASSPGGAPRRRARRNRALPGREPVVTRAWFLLLVLMQLAFVFVIPAGLGNDETGHLIRMWALTEGHFHCDKMPQAVRDLESKNLYTFRTRAQSWRDYWRGGLSMTGGGQRVDGSNYECGYFPLA